MENLFKAAFLNMPGLSEATGLLGGLLSAALIGGAVAAVFGIISTLVHGFSDTLKYLFVWRKKPEVMCTVSKLKDTKINYSLNEVKSRDFVFDVTVNVENKDYTLKYTKTMKKEKECDIKAGDSFLVFADTKKKTAENSTAMKKAAKKNLITLGVFAIVLIVFMLLIKR